MSVDRALWILVAAIAAAAFALLYARLARRANERALAYSNLAFFNEAIKPRAWGPRLLQAFWVGAVALLALAVAGPHLTLPVPGRDGNVFICIDTSGSMASTDV